MSGRFLSHPLLAERRIPHGFGLRGATPPPGLVRPRQVHGVDIVTLAECTGPEAPAADGIVSCEPNVPVGLVTADCLPILMAAANGAAVAAVHAGWRGLAAGVAAAGVLHLRALAGSQRLLAVVGPHIGPCCYEVDAPVTDALAARFGGALAASSTATRAGHARIDLGQLVRADLLAAGIEPGSIAEYPDACTRCNPERFHSFRRDGQEAGRMVHFVAAGSEQA